MELACRRHRITAYLAGIAVELITASLVVLALAAVPPDTTANRVLTALFLIALLPMSFQFMVFMRTDIYFVLQDLTGCHDLFADGRAYASHRLHRITHVFRNRSHLPTDPSAEPPARERTAVRIYSIVLVAGTTLCLATLALVTLPAEYTLLADAIRGLGPGHSVADNLDGAAVAASLGGFNLLWAITKWRTRRRRPVNRTGA